MADAVIEAASTVMAGYDYAWSENPRTGGAASYAHAPCG
jgi:hypothetical protein